MDALEHLVHLEIMDSLDQWDLWEVQVLLDNPDLLVYLAPPERTVNEEEVHPDLKDLKDPRDQLDSQEPVVSLDYPDKRVHKDLLVHQEMTDRWELLGSPEVLEHWVYLVQMPPIARAQHVQLMLVDTNHKVRDIDKATQRFNYYKSCKLDALCDTKEFKKGYVHAPQE